LCVIQAGNSAFEEKIKQVLTSEAKKEDNTIKGMLKKHHGT